MEIVVQRQPLPILRPMGRYLRRAANVIGRWSPGAGAPASVNLAWTIVSTLVVVVLTLRALHWQVLNWQNPLRFDDAYMFYRYAMHIREGLEIAWNPDGAPTYGMTSQLWVFFVLPFTFLPLDTGDLLRLASFSTGCAALAVMGLTVWRFAQSSIIRVRSIALLVTGLPLLAAAKFAYQMTTGMDTMLSLLANSLLVFALLDYVDRPRRRQAYAVGLVAFVAMLARPDNALCALATPLLLWASREGARRWGDLFGLVVLPFALIGIDLLVCRWYFGVALPLSFYAKWAHNYEGFQNPENAVTYLFYFLTVALPFFGTLGANLKRFDIYRIAAFLVPVIVTFLYLLTVRQIMGKQGRFYMPFSPFLVVPALLCMDSAVAQDARRAVIRTVIGIVSIGLIYLGAQPLRVAAEKAYMRAVLSEPDPVPGLRHRAFKPLPNVDYFSTVKTMGDAVSELPAGAIIAASEVGYIGARGVDQWIIDLVGLNDTRIAMHGFSVDELMQRTPDLIWFPHADYTGMRRKLFSDPRLLGRYVVVDGAFKYGVAIRKASPYRSQIEAVLRRAWTVTYPARSWDDYVVIP